MVDRLAIIINNRDTDFKLSVVVKLIGDRFAYETGLKIDKQFLTLEGDDIDKCFDLAKKHVREVLEGKKELNAIV